MNKQFAQCPNCGSEQRFCETLTNELKEKGYARENWRFSYDSKNGVVIDEAREAGIPIGASVPSYNIVTDICVDCGTVYAVALRSGSAPKSIAPPKLFKPGQEPHGNDPRYS